MMAGARDENPSVQKHSVGRSVADKGAAPTTTAPKLPPLCVCAECGTQFYKLRHDQIFCPAPRQCRRIFHRRKETRGAKLLSFAMDWRKSRKPGGFAELTQMIDGFLREDREREARTKRGKS